MQNDVEDGSLTAAGPSDVGQQLRDARIASGRSVEDIAQETRISQRYLTAIENGAYHELPGKTYISGFVRAYARAVGLDEVAVAQQVRGEVDASVYSVRPPFEVYEPSDPARLPSRSLVTTGLIALAVLAAAYGVWRFVSMEPADDLATAEVSAPQDDAATAPAGGTAATASGPAAPAVSAGAPVTITAQSEAWIGFDDTAGKTVTYRTLKPGEVYQVPAEIRDSLFLRTVRPQAITIAVDGRTVPSLGPADTMVKNVSLKPADLAARIDGTPAPAANTAPAGNTPAAAGSAGSGAVSSPTVPAPATANVPPPAAQAPAPAR